MKSILSVLSFMDHVFGKMSLCMCVCSDATIVSNSVIPWTVASRLLCPWASPGKNTGVGFHALLQGIFLTQGSNPHLLVAPAL